MLKSLISSIKKTVPDSIKYKIKKTRPNITQEWFPAKPGLEKGRVLLIVIRDNFNQEILRASTLLTLGYARGWTEACGPAKLIWERNLVSEIKQYKDPIVCTNIYNYTYWGNKEIKILKNCDSFAIVNIHPRKHEEFSRQNPLNNFGDPLFYGGYEKTCSKLFKTEPNLVCSFAGQAAWEWYKGWQEDGLKFEFIKLAADPYYYYPEPNPEKFSHIKMAYVGGYWPEKAQAFDLYLRPFENILHTFGYGQWPYKHYEGKINTDEERQLYSSAGLIPLVTSPAGWMMAEVTERYFKAPACRAFCIADQNPGLREIFREDEMLQAKNAEHFAVIVNNFLKGNIDVERWKNKAYLAVMGRHLYKHRALQIKNLIETKKL
ncbi:MAG: glycosyltransferase [Candidatus Falkowbacteria bacterium]